MNIAIAHDWLTNMAGGEKVLLEISNLYPDAPIFTSVFDPHGAKSFAKKDVRPSFLQKWPFFKSKRELLVPFSPFAFEQHDLSKYNLILTSCSFPSKGVITKPGAIQVCYCHTPARYLWDSAVDPRAKKGGFDFLRTSLAHKLRVWDRLAANRVDHFIANSKYVAARIKKFYGRDSVVIYPPVNVDQFRLAPEKEIKDYYLFVSRLVDYKKCGMVVEAFNDLRLPLKIIGRGPDKKKIEKIARGNIEILGFLSDEKLKKYYSEAKAFVFAAEEDFGIVPVEAMASGRPVIAFANGGTAESVIDGVTGKLFLEQTPQCLIDAVKHFDPSKYDPKKIRKHAEKFSNERFRQEYKQEIEKIIKSMI